MTATEILGLLVKHGDTYVAERLQAYVTQLANDDPSVVQTLLSEATGSMGSLRDRYLSPDNGDRITPAEQAKVNAHLAALVVRLAEQSRSALKTAGGIR